MTTFTATYSPDDNKIRLYASTRLDAETYARVKAAGFAWAPKQELFVAPMWTPQREDLAVELAGELDDEDTSLTERAEDRADRFTDYSDKRTDDAHRAREYVATIAEGIRFGQPILVGHHSERHARKDAERIENGMRKAVKMWETASYWTGRAAGAIQHAKYKELPAVRARRIKTIEADLRKQQRSKADSERDIRYWETLHDDDSTVLKRKDGSTGTFYERALCLANTMHYSRCYTVSDFPRTRPEQSTYEGMMGLWSALGGSDGEPAAIVTPEWAQGWIIRSARRSIAWCNRWICHYENRLAYERAMLKESGGTAADKTGPEVGGGCRCWASHGGGWSYIVKVNKVSVSVLDNWGHGGGNFKRIIPFDKLNAVMTAQEVKNAQAEGRLIETSDKTGFHLVIADTAPTPVETPPQPEPERTDFDAMKDSLKAGVQVVSAPQLFPTPPALAAQVVEAAGIEAGMTVLEPSAGTGNLVRAVIDSVDTEIVGYEINRNLCSQLDRTFPSYKLKTFCEDFLQATRGMGQYPRIVMNPPFERGADITHILHAVKFLAPGGRLVAICANGPRQRAALLPIAENSGGYWEDLPPGSFEQSGTGVNTALVVIEA